MEIFFPIFVCAVDFVYKKKFLLALQHANIKLYWNQNCDLNNVFLPNKNMNLLLTQT